MTFRSDLAIECSEMQGHPAGVKVEEKQVQGLKITDVNVETQEAGRQIGKPVGRYITIDLPKEGQDTQGVIKQAEAVAGCITQLIPHEGEVLVIGLGNRDITPDALGPRAVEQVVATRHLPGELPGIGRMRKVSCMSPGVLGTTGIESVDIISGLNSQTKPAAIIAIDALASRRLSRLATTVQISNIGINPGSGVGNNRMEISQKTLGIPVIAIGVPMVVDGTTMACDLLHMDDGSPNRKKAEQDMGAEGREYMVTPREVDQMVSSLSQLLGLSINLALQPGVPPDTLMELMG